MHRRDFIRLGSVAGLGLAQLLRLKQLAAAPPANAPPASSASAGANSTATSSDGGADSATRRLAERDINCIFIFILGGMPHQDMWDLKPDAPAEIRGDFQPIATPVPGMQIGDVLPKTATVMDRLSIIRSMTHGDSDHGRGCHIMMTGKKAGAGDFNGAQNNNQHPCVGSMVARLGRGGALPPYVSVPNLLNSGGPSFLGPSYGPFTIEADPAAPDFAVRDITLPASVTTRRGQRRQDALREIHRFQERVEHAATQVKALDSFYEKAYGIMTSAKAKEAFDIQRESAETRENYGMTSLGQCCLLSRRLVEAGCRFVSIENGHWDTHRKNTSSLRELLCPSFDQAIPTLVRDLEQRGLLDSTLVVITTEFGRTPRINDLAGRDHWPNAFSIVLGGGGVKPGQILGATDKQAAAVVDRPVTPQDLTATLLHALGINHQTILHTPLGRPVPLVDGGKPVHELLS